MIGVGGHSSGGAEGTGGGKGVESHEENGGKVWRFEAGSRNGGTGVDSSAEELGTKDIAGEGFGGVVRLKERTRVGTEDECGGLQGSFCGGRELHVDMFLTLLVDKRRMSRSLTLISHPVLTLQSHSFMTCQHVVENTFQIDHGVKAEFSKNDLVEIRAVFL